MENSDNFLAAQVSRFDVKAFGMRVEATISSYKATQLGPENPVGTCVVRILSLDTTRNPRDLLE
jgi:hypothetical protein